MAETRFFFTQNGQEVQQADLTSVSDNAALADDHVLAELLRCAPYDGSNTYRGILPYNFRESNVVGTRATVSPYLSSGTPAAGPKVTVSPFRAIVGSRTAEASGALDNWRDIRSTVFVGATAAKAQDLTITTPDATYPRWDLVYARVDVDTDSALVNRWFKSPTTGGVNYANIATSKRQTVSVAVKAGTAAASPVLPDIDPDGAGYYMIPLAYVRVTAGVSIIQWGDIYEASTVAILANGATGVAAVRPANQQWVPGGTVMTHLPWSAIADTRPIAYMPPSMVGAQSILVAFRSEDTLVTRSHYDEEIVDDSRDWRRRLWTWQAGTGLYLPFTETHPGTGTIAPVCYSPTRLISGMGQSFYTGGPAVIDGLSPAGFTVAALTTDNCADMGTDQALYLYVDSVSGALKIKQVGPPQVSAIFWLTASGSYQNF